MKISNLYLFAVGILLIGATSCSKSPSSKGNSGNDTGNGVVNPNGKDLPAGALDGVTFINGGKSAIFNLYAPKKKSVTLIGDFSNWSATDTKYVMNNTKDGTRWWIQIDNLD